MPHDPIRVLLVEDNEGDAELIAELIAERMGPAIDLVHAVRLREACELLERETVDVVLLDLSLPDGHGMESVARMREAAPGLPLVVLTSLDDQPTALAAVHAGAQDYLVKGEDDGRVIRRALRYAMERQALERERADLLRREREARRLAEHERERAEAARRLAVEMEQRASFLAAAGARLLGALDPQATLATLARILVPALARRATTFLVNGDVELERVASAGLPRRSDEPDPLSTEAVTERIREWLGPSAPHTRQLSQPVSDDPLTLLLHARGRIVGVLAVEPGEGHALSAMDVSLLRDLADRAALGVENGHSFEAARRAVHARDQMLGVVSHDLRSPISAVIMCAESLLDASPPTADETARLGELVRDSARWMQRIIRDLLDVTAIEAGKLTLLPEPVSPLALLERILAMHEPIARERDIVLARSAPDSAPILEADPDRLAQAAGNLVANAIKFSSRGGLVRLELQVRDGEVTFHVRDNGPGIDPAQLPFIFDRYWQGLTRRSEGAGLGLAIARGIAEAHGGRITVESVPALGSTFSLHLPVAAAAGRRSELSRSPG